MYELNNILEVETPLGRGKAILINLKDNDTYWTVVLNDTRAIVTFRQDQLRVVRNYSMGWGISDEELAKIINPST